MECVNTHLAQYHPVVPSQRHDIRVVSPRMSGRWQQVQDCQEARMVNRSRTILP